jgi:hypothetical protein
MAKKAKKAAKKKAKKRWRRRRRPRSAKPLTGAVLTDCPTLFTNRALDSQTRVGHKVSALQGAKTAGTGEAECQAAEANAVSRRTSA